MLQWKFYSLAIPKLGVILFVGKLNADGEAPHLQHWGQFYSLAFQGVLFHSLALEKALNWLVLGNKTCLFPQKMTG